MPSCPIFEMRLGATIPILVAFHLLTAPGGAQTTWVLKSSGVSESLSGVAYGNGRFVVVGQSGTILTSPDATTWTPQTSGTSEDLRGVAFGSGKFLAVGGGGTALTSPDGVTWTPQNPRTGAFLSGATFADGRFVAVGGSGAVRFSSDGETWDFGLGLPGEFLQSVTFGAGSYVAVGEAGRIVSSTDAQVWQVETSNTTAYLTGVTNFNGLFVAAGNTGTLLSSGDGAAWSGQTSGTSEWIRAVAGGSQQVVAVGASGVILVSSNGVDWAPATSGVTTTLNGVARGGGQFVAVGDPSGAPSEGVILASEEATSGTSFEMWQEAEFTPSELADPAISGPSADPNQNGLTNFGEYAFGLPPKVAAGPGQLPIAEISRTGGGPAQSEISFRRPADRVGHVTYSLQYSLDLGGWIDLGVAEEIVSESDGIQQVRLIDANPTEVTKFYQVVVADASAGT